MMEVVHSILMVSEIGEEASHLNYLLLLGIAIAAGSIGAKIFQRLSIPQIVGFVVIGILLGPVFKLIGPETIRVFEPFNRFALGIIGFLIGGELKREIFVKFGRQVSMILLFEGLLAFFLVGTLSFLIMWYFSNWQTALAVGVVFAAICAATDPASTINVLWEYKTRGPLTTMLTAVVALDDALALVLYAIGISVAGVVIGGDGDNGFWRAMGFAFYEIFGSLAVGTVIGLLLNWVVKKIDEEEKIFVFTISAALLVVGLAVTFHFDVILASMAAGVILINVRNRKASSVFELLNHFAIPIYVLFFVLVGARMNIAGIDLKILLLVLAYVGGSIVGKTAGAFLGSWYAGSADTVQKYLGFCLYPQGGIAVGLLIMASGRFDPATSDLMILVVVAGAFVLQIIGPIGVKIAAKKAGEVGLNVTEEDLIRGYKVGDIMDKQPPLIPAGMQLNELIQLVSETDNNFYPVVNEQGELLGGITIEGMRNVFLTQELNDWLVALDLMEPVMIKTSVKVPLADALEDAREAGVENFPVTDPTARDKVYGVIETSALHRLLAAQVLAKQREADRMYGFKMG